MSSKCMPFVHFSCTWLKQRPTKAALVGQIESESSAFQVLRLGNQNSGWQKPFICQRRPNLIDACTSVMFAPASPKRQLHPKAPIIDETSVDLAGVLCVSQHTNACTCGGQFRFHKGGIFVVSGTSNRDCGLEHAGKPGAHWQHDAHDQSPWQRSLLEWFLADCYGWFLNFRKSSRREIDLCRINFPTEPRCEALDTVDDRLDIFVAFAPNWDAIRVVETW